MDEDITVVFGADADFVGDETAARAADRGGRGVEIVHLHGDMVDALAALFEEAGERRIRGGGLQQFDARTACRQHGGFDAFLRDNDAAARRRTQNLAVELQRAFDGTHGDADMIDFHFSPPPVACATACRTNS